MGRTGHFLVVVWSRVPHLVSIPSNPLRQPRKGVCSDNIRGSREESRRAWRCSGISSVGRLVTCFAIFPSPLLLFLMTVTVVVPLPLIFLSWRNLPLCCGVASNADSRPQSPGNLTLFPSAVCLEVEDGDGKWNVGSRRSESDTTTRPSRYPWNTTYPWNTCGMFGD
ncbi:hypothetical protein B0T13DRAFT_277658 [Neurospora crassa]|nr:hypothetical protein B0T13DRAFT_277658 [Neurospora crassa]